MIFLRRFLLLVLAVLIVGLVNAQETTTAKPKQKSKKKSTNSSTNTTGKKKKKEKTYLDDGRDWRTVYVVQVMSTSDRVKVYENKAKVYQMFPKQRVYVKNELPFYRLRLGFFSTKEKAEKYRKQIGDKFGEPAIVVRDKVVLNTIIITKRRAPKTPETNASTSTTATATKEKNKGISKSKQ